MVSNINKLYQCLIDLVTENMPEVAMVKSDIDDFEVHPAIGFGIPSIRNSDIMGTDKTVQMDIPCVIEDYGASADLTLSTTTMYEDLRNLVFNDLRTYLDDANLNYANIDMLEFLPLQIPADQTIRGLSGYITIIIEI